MNKLDLLKEKLVLLADLISKSEDEEKIKAYIAERDGVNIEIGKEMARLEAEEKARKDKEDAEKKEIKDKQKKSPFAGQSGIEYGEDHNYKGINMKRLMDNIDLVKGVSPELIEAIQKRPERAEGVLKVFIDLFERGSVNPAQLKAALQEGTDSEGGYLVPTEQRAELLAYIREQSVAVPDVTRISMTSDSMTIPRELTQVGVAWTAEESDATESEPTFDQVALAAKRLDAYSVTSNELLEDNNVPGGIAAVLLSQFVEAVAKELDNQILTGTGDPISGVFTAQAGYSEVFSSGSTHFSELLESNLRNLIGKIPPERRANGKIYAHNTIVWTYLYGLKDSDGRNLFIPSNVDAVPGRVMGYPVKESSQATSTSAADTAMLVLGNLRGFYLGERLSRISLFVDPYTAAKSYQTNFYMFTRWAFAHALPNYYGRIVTAAS